MENNEQDIEEEVPRKLRFDWAPGVMLRPRTTLRAVCAAETPVWAAALLLLTALALFAVLAAGGPRRIQAQGSAPVPNEESMQWLTPEQQEQFAQAGTAQQGAFFIYFLPGMGALLGIWGGWALLSILLHFAWTLSGSRSSSLTAFNLTAWASLPLGLRLLVQGIYYLGGGVLIQSSGLSGFIPAEAGGALQALRFLLARVDLYWLWQTALLLIGSVLVTGLRRGKAWGVTLGVMLLSLALASLPGYLAARLGGAFSGGGGFFFF